MFLPRQMHAQRIIPKTSNKQPNLKEIVNSYVGRIKFKLNSHFHQMMSWHPPSDPLMEDAMEGRNDL